jgi:3'(2'), 5'-bisphosphate nucleotidase
VDPLDGTREFISRNGEFTVNIGLVEDGQPVLGVVTAPAKGLAWWGAVGQGAWRREEGRAAARPRYASAAAAGRLRRGGQPLAPRRRDRPLPRERGIEETVSAGSSLKFCLVARAGRTSTRASVTTMEWDTAAGLAVLRAAGGACTRSGEPLAYGKPAFRNPGFIAEGA